MITQAINAVIVPENRISNRQPAIIPVKIIPIAKTGTENSPLFIFSIAFLCVMPPALPTKIVENIQNTQSIHTGVNSMENSSSPGIKQETHRKIRRVDESRKSACIPIEYAMKESPSSNGKKNCPAPVLD